MIQRAEHLKSPRAQRLGATSATPRTTIGASAAALVIPGRRGRIIKESLALTFASWAIALLGTGIWDWGGPLEVVAKVGSLIFFLLGAIGLLRFLYAFLFVKDASYLAAEPVFPAVPRQAALPPQQEIPLTDYPRRPNTKEMSPRYSVTENTTRLLDDQTSDAEN